MCKKILGCLAIVIIAIVAAINMNLSSAESLSDMALANVEALARGEYDGSGEPCYKGEYSSSNPVAVSCATPCVPDRKGGDTDVC